MELPILHHSHFVVLSALVDGEARTYRELRELMRWNVAVSSWYRMVVSLSKQGLVERKRTLLRRDGSVRADEYALVITSEGLAAWREQSDFYLYDINLLGSDAANSDHDTTIIAMKAAEPTKRKQERAATPSEQRRLRQTASPELLHAWSAIVSMPAKWARARLWELQIEDVDLENLRVRVRGEWHSIACQLGEAIRLGIGDRHEGPALMAPSGLPWNQRRFSKSWSKLRKVADVPNNVVIRRKPKPTGRPRMRRRAI